MSGRHRYADRTHPRQIDRDWTLLAPLGQYALPPQQEREPRSDDSSMGSVARLGVSTYASLQAANGVDLYKALGISSQASLLEIKVAFRRLAKALHPDRNAGATRSRFILYEALKFAAATVILTAAFVTGVSVWQRSSIGTQRAETLETGTEAPRAQAPITVSTTAPIAVTSAELADALFGTQADQYGNEAARPRNEALAANNAVSAPSETVVA